ncbi:thiol:disulfide interchange protein DsbA/DsbL [Aeromonas dhakensis]|uniref:thiol:disulfide interchange protein DsbA/DsbL n=1 Tax=Aeromonas dhakensis TaxID=196024 RepID=UPI003416053C
MNKVIIFFATMLILPMSYAAPQFKEGIHYETLSNASSAQPEVLEFFSYFCPSCANFEPIVKGLKKTLPEGVPLKKNHVVFFGQGMGPQMQRAFAVASLLNVEEKITAAIFHKMQQRQSPKCRADVRNIFVESGISAEKFDNLIDSFAVTSMVAQFDHNTKKYNVRAAPTFLINEKYVVKLESIRSLEQFNQIVAFLLKKV